MERRRDVQKFKIDAFKNRRDFYADFYEKTIRAHLTWDNYPAFAYYVVKKAMDMKARNNKASIPLN